MRGGAGTQISAVIIHARGGEVCDSGEIKLFSCYIVSLDRSCQIDGLDRSCTVCVDIS